MLVKLTKDLWVNAAQIFCVRTREVEGDEGTSYHLYVYRSNNTNDYVTVVLKSEAQRDLLIQEIEQALKAC